MIGIASVSIEAVANGISSRYILVTPYYESSDVSTFRVNEYHSYHKSKFRFGQFLPQILHISNPDLSFFT